MKCCVVLDINVPVSVMLNWESIPAKVVMEGRKTEESYLVTGNIKHFPAEPFVVTSREMIGLIESQ